MPINFKRIFTDKSYTDVKRIYDKRTLRIARALYWAGVLCAILSVVFFIQNRLAYAEYNDVLDKISTADPHTLIVNKLIANRTILGRSFALPRSPELQGLAGVTQTTFTLFLFSTFSTYLFAFARVAVIAQEREKEET